MSAVAKGPNLQSGFVGAIASRAWLLAVFVLLIEASQTAFWSDLADAVVTRGEYAQTRARVAFSGLPIEELVPRLNAALPLTTPIALGGSLERSEFARQRLTELLYPRSVSASAAHRLEATSVEAFQPAAGLELTRTARSEVFFLSGTLPAPVSASPGESLDFSLLAFLGSILAALGFGSLLDRWLDVGGTLRLPTRLLAGAVVIGLLATVTTWLQVAVRPLVWNVVGLALFVTATAWSAVHRTRTRGVLSELRASLRAPENLLMALVLLLFFFTMLQFPITLWDGRSIWLFHAKELYFRGFLSRTDALAILWNRPEYPLLHSAWMAHFTGLSSLYDERLAALGVPVLFSAVIAFVWQLLRRTTSRGIGAALTLTAFFSVSHITAGGHADAQVMFLLLLQFLALQSRETESLGWLAAAAASLTKFEGAVLASLVAGACLLAVPHLRERGGFKRVAPLLVLAPAYLHVLWGKSIGLVGAFHGIDWENVRAHFSERLSQILSSTLSALSVPTLGRDHGLTWEGLAALILSLTLWVLMRRAHSAGKLSIALALAFTFVATALMLITPLDLAWHVRTAMPRLLLHPALLALVSPFLLLKESGETEIDREISVGSAPVPRRP